MAALTVILAPPGTAGAVLDVLRDWSALGVIEPFLWVRSEAVNGEVAPALKITGGTAVGTTVQAQVADSRNDLRRICVLVPLAESACVVSSSQEQTVARLLESAGPTIRIRLLLPRPGAGQGGATLARMGWHNILLSAEDSGGPEATRITLGSATSTIELGSYAAAGTAGVAGLWTDVATSPLDSMAMLPGESLRLARTFYRRVRTDDAERRLRAQVSSTAADVPLPRRPGGGCVRIEDLQTETNGMADRLFARHPGVLRGSRVTTQAVQPVPLGVMAILRMFGAFMIAAIKNAPLQWYRSTVNRVSSAAARTVQNAVFGQEPAAYQTVVNGMTPEGLPTSWSEWGAAASSMESAAIAATGTVRQRQRDDLSPLWRDYAAAAMTLVDAGDRVDGLGPIEFGSDRGVVASIEQVVPGRRTSFQELPPHLAAAIGFEAVRAEDVLGVDLVRRRLLHVATAPSLALDAGRAEQGLRDWHSRYRASFSVQVGRRIAGAIADRRQEIVELLGRIADAAGTDGDEQAERRRQRALSRRLRWIVGGAVVIALGVLFAAGFGVLLLPVGLAVAGVVLLVAVCVTLALFVRGQRRLFAELNRRQRAVAQVEVDRQNLIEALADLRRLSDAYGEYLAWSRVIGAFLALPFGPPPSNSEAGTGVTTGFPRSTRIGVADVDARTVADAAAQLRHRTFTVGWLEGPWTALLGEAGERIGSDGFELQADPSLLFKQPGVPAASLLTRWMAAVEIDGPSAVSGDQWWTEVIIRLRTEWTDIGDLLLRSIRCPDDIGFGEADLARFVADVDAAGQTPGTGYFDDTLLSPRARTSGQAAVDVAIGFSCTAGLGLVAVLTELSRGIEPYEVHAETAPSASPVEPTDLTVTVRNGDPAKAGLPEVGHTEVDLPVVVPPPVPDWVF
jgi:hypothetical protein